MSRKLVVVVFFIFSCCVGLGIRPGVVSVATSDNVSRISLPQHPLQRGFSALNANLYAQAVTALQEFIAANPQSLLLDHAYFALARARLKLGRYTEAEAALRQLKVADPQSLLGADAEFLEADGYFYRQDYESAIQRYQALQKSKSYRNHPRMPAASLRLAQCYERQRQFGAAVKQYHQTWGNFIFSASYPLARDHEARLLNASPDLAAQFSTKTLFSLIATLLKKGKAADALPWLRRLQARALPALDQETLRLRFAETYYVLRRNAKSRAYLREFLRDYPMSKRVPYVFDRIGRLYLREGRFQDFLRNYAVLSEKYPKSSYSASALRLYAKELLLQQNFQESAAQFQHFLRRYPKSALVSDVLWDLGRAQYQMGQYRNVRKTFERLMRVYPKSSHRTETLYWTGRAAEQLREYERAAQAYLKLLAFDQNSYLGEISRQALVRLKASVPTLRIAQEKKNLKPLRLDEALVFATSRGTRHWRKAQELEQLKLFTPAAREFAYALQQERRPTSAHYLALARLYRRSGQYHALARLMRRRFWHWIARGDERLPREFWEYVYPLSYFESTSRYAAETGVDPLFVQSLMLAESLFDAQAVSPVGALGLMQIMPTTGRKLAADVGTELRAAEELLQPEVNIRLGTAYLQQLLALFQQQLPPAIAGYNAGEHRVKEWWQASYRDNPAAFIAMIPYRETKNYVQKVLWYYREYRRIYRTTQ